MRKKTLNGTLDTVCAEVENAVPKPPLAMPAVMYRTDIIIIMRRNVSLPNIVIPAPTALKSQTCHRLTALHTQTCHRLTTIPPPCLRPSLPP